MKRSKQLLLGGIALASALQATPAWAANSRCYWDSGGSNMMNYQRNVGTLYVPRDAPVGTVIGQVDTRQLTSNGAGLRLRCDNGDPPDYLLFNARNTVPLFPGVINPINGEDVTGKILQTNIQGVGVRVKLGFPLSNAPNAANAFNVIGGSAAVPYDAFNQRVILTQIILTGLSNDITLVKTGPLAPGPHTLDGRELLSGHYPYLGKVFGYGLTGTVIQTQCSVGVNPVSADPVPLGGWDTADFSGVGYTTTAVPFQINLTNCVAAPAGGLVTTAHIRLDGVNGSAPVGPQFPGVFSLAGGSGAAGMGIQILQGDGVTPVALEAEVPVSTIAVGNQVLDFNARFYQTAPSAQVRPGIARGALNFTMTYK